jgi:hypothetical protein
MLDARLIDAVISLPLNMFYGAGIPACLLILFCESSARLKAAIRCCSSTRRAIIRAIQK